MSAPKGLWLHGSSGRMGHEIQRTLLEAKRPHASEFHLVGGSAATFEGPHLRQGQRVTSELLGASLAREEVTLVLDFTSDAGNLLLLEALEKNSLFRNRAVVIGTTGLSEPQLERWRVLSNDRQLATLLAPNTSVGILLTVRAALGAAGVLASQGFDIEIVETHHRHKKDAPSGTARFIGQALVDHVPGLKLVTDRKGEREPGEIGMHSVRGGSIYGEHEVRMIGDSEEITISHRALSRALFASGALVLGSWLSSQKPGFYGLLDVTLPAAGR